MCQLQPAVDSHFSSSEVETVIHSDNDFATVAYLRIKNANLETKQGTHLSVTIPPLLEDGFMEVERTVSQSSAVLKIPAPSTTLENLQEPPKLRQASRLSGPWITLANICAEPSEGSFENEVEKCFQKLQGNQSA